MRDYARRLSADFSVILDHPFKKEGVAPHFAKFVLGKLLQDYERVLYLDCDLIVSPTAPDIFAAVPPKCLGAFIEGKLTDRTEEINRISQSLGAIPGWTTSSYFNSGVMVLSREHKQLFDQPDHFNFNTKFFDQTYLNWKAQTLKIQIYDLDLRFNAMFPFSTDPENAWIRHFAGWGAYPPYNWQDKPPYFPFKYHQMRAHVASLDGKRTFHFHPEQFVRDLGQLIAQPSGIHRLYCPPKVEGVVCYGPYIAMAAGHYQVHIDYTLETQPSFVQTVFCFDLVCRGGKQVLYAATVNSDNKAVQFNVDVPDVTDLEVRFWVLGEQPGFHLNLVQLQQSLPTLPTKSWLTPLLRQS